MEDYLLPPLDAPLNEDELNDLSGFLDSIPDAMSLEMTDGFFAALVCSPSMVIPSRFLGCVIGEDHEFASIEEAEKYTHQLLRHWNTVSGQLHEKDIYAPILMEGEGKSPGNEWAIGFLAGMKHCGEEWDDYLNDDDQSGVFVPILMLAHEHDPDTELRSGPIDPEQREKLLAAMALSVPVIYTHLAQFRELYIPKNSPVETFQRTTRKIGRNEPCPCGSKLKYKKCCGKG